MYWWPADVPAYLASQAGELQPQEDQRANGPNRGECLRRCCSSCYCPLTPVWSPRLQGVVDDDDDISVGHPPCHQPDGECSPQPLHRPPAAANKAGIRRVTGGATPAGAMFPGSIPSTNFDSSLDPTRLQANIQLACSLARRAGDLPDSAIPSDRLRLGSNRDATDQRQGERLLRRFADMVFVRPHRPARRQEALRPEHPRGRRPLCSFGCGRSPKNL